ncbi:MAG: PorV/PorQ family protein [Elusimicrobia bacterium]|nr:PorV/PorQ family protein [Elusimicrobiota bacterium]
MKKNLFNVFVFTTYHLLLTTYSLHAATISDKSGTTGYTFLKIAQGARAVAMGECYVALADDVNAIYFNPAGLAKLSSREIGANYTLWFEDINKSYIGYIHPPFKFGTLGLAVNYVGIPFEKRTVEDDFNYEKVTLSNLAISVAWGKNITEKMDVGAAIKIITEDLDAKRNTGLAVDLGGIYKLKEDFNIGVSLQNIGTDMDSDYKDPLPMNIRLGVAKKLLDNKLTAISDFYMGIADGTMSIGLGGEYKLAEMFRPRLGYRVRLNNNNLTGLTGLTAGFGIKYNKYHLDYALAPYGELGTTHRLDFIVKF